MVLNSPSSSLRVDGSSLEKLLLAGHFIRHRVIARCLEEVAAAVVADRTSFFHWFCCIFVCNSIHPSFRSDHTDL